METNLSSFSFHLIRLLGANHKLTGNMLIAIIKSIKKKRAAMRFILLVLATAFLFSPFILSQSKIEEDIEVALVNAKKGVYWALSNLQGKKAKFEKSLIADDKLVAKVKVSKELNGIKIESIGFSQTNELAILLYRSADSLIKDGYIKKNDLETYSEDE